MSACVVVSLRFESPHPICNLYCRFSLFTPVILVKKEYKKLYSVLVYIYIIP